MHAVKEKLQTIRYFRTSKQPALVKTGTRISDHTPHNAHHGEQPTRCRSSTPRHLRRWRATPCLRRTSRSQTRLPTPSRPCHFHHRRTTSRRAAGITTCVFLVLSHLRCFEYPLDAGPNLRGRSERSDAGKGFVFASRASIGDVLE